MGKRLNELHKNKTICHGTSKKRWMQMQKEGGINKSRNIDIFFTEEYPECADYAARAAIEDNSQMAILIIPDASFIEDWCAGDVCGIAEGWQTKNVPMQDKMEMLDAVSRQSFDNSDLFNLREACGSDVLKYVAKILNDIGYSWLHHEAMTKQFIPNDKVEAIIYSDEQTQRFIRYDFEGGLEDQPTMYKRDIGGR